MDAPVGKATLEDEIMCYGNDGNKERLNGRKNELADQTSHKDVQ